MVHSVYRFEGWVGKWCFCSTCTCVHVEQKNLFAFIIERSLYRKFSAASNVFMAQFGDNVKAFYQSNWPHALNKSYHYSYKHVCCVSGHLAASECPVKGTFDWRFCLQLAVKVLCNCHWKYYASKNFIIMLYGLCFYMCISSHVSIILILHHSYKHIT